MGTTTTQATTVAPGTQYDVATIMGGLYGDGIVALKGAFEREWVRELGEDIERLFAEQVAEHARRESSVSERVAARVP